MFHLYCAYADLESSWSVCLFRKCRERRRCCFGPRGTFRRTGGVPLCRTGALFRMWREELPDEVRREFAVRAGRKAAIDQVKAMRAKLEIAIMGLLASSDDKESGEGLSQ